MKATTLEQYSAYLQRQAELNNLPFNVLSEQRKFNVTPSVQQTIYEKLRESSAFLGAISFVFPEEQQGETLGLDSNNTIAGTTDTSGDQTRKTSDIASLIKQTYFCQQINFDTHITYARLDMWAKFPDFQKRVAAVALKQKKRDLIMVGFNGTSRAPTSNRQQNPLLQDVGVGWLEKIRLNAPQRNMNGKEVGNQVLVGKGQRYDNLDALVMDATEELIDEWHRDDTDLVVIVGRKLLADKYFPIVNKENAPTEQLAADVIISQKRIGGLKAVRVPFFPANAILITKLENLAIYVQEGTTRKHIKDVPERDRIETYESENLDYIVEDYGCTALIENITLEDKVEDKANG
ncbi:phage major capsid protein, P2 family [Muribacter muris]|uniref:Phage major capsid protein, P2 family n=1 Tax=Muribacter muris TaxID=67855 RepID=A0A4Y9K713_9PAST|nr:phage major capsid protein, P2 family [Muribacter muris]MBF0783895.1 phage major capsid protein, P2 family [Muribacter muris]MBF0826393.1 phage major capsid protein, P2 family [Muribacter muris]TFV13292.1 phage major capsid protein, P2 family [Muribacter muris]